MSDVRTSPCGLKFTFVEKRGRIVRMQTPNIKGNLAMVGLFVVGLALCVADYLVNKDEELFQTRWQHWLSMFGIASICMGFTVRFGYDYIDFTPDSIKSGLGLWSWDTDVIEIPITFLRDVSCEKREGKYVLLLLGRNDDEKIAVDNLATIEDLRWAYEQVAPLLKDRKVKDKAFEEIENYLAGERDDEEDDA